LGETPQEESISEPMKKQRNRETDLFITNMLVL